MRLTENEKGEIVYNTSVAVLLTEILKLLVAKVLARATEDQEALKEASSTKWTEWCQYGAPALIYAIQNNLNIYGISYLSAPVFT